MKKKIITGFFVLASMIGSTSFAQNIYKTTADVSMVKLNNGVLMPRFGLGTFLQGSDEVCRQSCLTAATSIPHTLTMMSEVWDRL